MGPVMRKVDPRSQNEKRRARTARRRQLIANIGTAAQVLCDSHKREDQDKVLHRMLRSIIELTAGRINDERKQALAVILEKCAYGGTPSIDADGEAGLVYINGHFDATELSRHMVWGGLAEDASMKTIGEGNG